MNVNYRRLFLFNIFDIFDNIITIFKYMLK